MCGRMQVRCFSRLLLLMLMLMLALVGLNPPSVYACPCRLQVQLIWPARPAFVDLDRPRPAIGARPPTSTLSASAAGPAQPRVVDVGGLGMPMYVRRPGLVLRGDTQSLEYLTRPTSVVVSQLGFGGPTRVDVARQPSLAPPAFVDVESRQGLGTPMPVDVSCQPGLSPPVVGNVRRPGPKSVNVVGVARPTLLGDVHQLGPQPADVVDVADRPMPTDVHRLGTLTADAPMCATDIVACQQQLSAIAAYQPGSATAADVAAYQQPTSTAAAYQVGPLLLLTLQCVSCRRPLPRPSTSQRSPLVLTLQGIRRLRGSDLSQPTLASIQPWVRMLLYICHIRYICQPRS